MYSQEFVWRIYSFLVLIMDKWQIILSICKLVAVLLTYVEVDSISSAVRLNCGVLDEDKELFYLFIFGLVFFICLHFSS